MMNSEEKNGAVSVPKTTGAPVLPQPGPAQKPADGQLYSSYREPLPVLFTGKDAVFALLFLVCGYFFVWLVHPQRLGFGVTLFTLLFCAVTLAYQKRGGVPVTGEGFFWLVAVLISAVNFSLLSNVSLQFLNLLLLMGMAVYWVAVLNSTRLEPSMGRYFAADMVNQLFQVPFRNFGCAVKILRESAAKNKKSKTLLAVLCGALVAIPLLFLVFSLLIEADAGFEAMMRKISDSVGTEVVNFLLRLLPAFLVGSYLFGLLYGNLQKRYVDSLTAESAGRFSKSLKKLPSAASLTVLCLLCAVYLLFLGSQTVTLFSAIQNRPPEGFTYAEFARRGFFELCEVVFINLAVMLSGFFFTRSIHSREMLRLMNVILSVETMLLIVTAISKMILYIGQYGLTQKRVYTSCFMIVLFLVFCLIIVAQFQKINLTKGIVVVCCASFLMLCYANADGLIAQYNVDRYLNGNLKDAGVSMMYAAPDASMPAALRLYRQTNDPGVKSELEQFFLSRNNLKIPFAEQNLQQVAAQGSIPPIE